MFVLSIKYFMETLTKYIGQVNDGFQVLSFLLCVVIMLQLLFKNVIVIRPDFSQPIWYIVNLALDMISGVINKSVFLKQFVPGY